MEVYVIFQEWNINCGKDCQVLTKGYTDLKDAQKVLKELLEREKKNNWWFDLNNENTFLTETEVSWCIDVNYNDKFMETRIQKITI